MLASPVLIAGMFGTNGTLTQTGIVLGVAATAIGLTKPVWMQIFRAFQRLQQFFDDWFGEPARDGQKERPGAMARLAELENNGGGSLKDTIDRIEKKVEVVGEQAGHAVIAAGLAVNEAKVGRAVIAEASAQNIIAIREVSLRTAEQAEVATIQRGILVQTIEDMGTALRTEAAERTAEGYRLLVEHGGPDLSQPVPNHTPDVSPPMPIAEDLPE